MFSLETMCLNVVVEEFERFFTILMVSKEETRERDFYFLQLKYAYELLSGLSSRRKLKCEYLYSLANKHLKRLSCDWLTGTRYENAIGDILCRVPNVTKISSFRSICKDETLENIAKFCPKIVEIQSRKSSVTDTGVKYLCKNESGNVSCPKLKHLIVKLKRVSYEGLACLIRDLPSLETTTFSKKIPLLLYLIHKELSGLKNVHKYSFVELNLIKYGKLSYYSDLLKICLTVCPRLKEFSCYISAEEQLNFFENNGLEKLIIKFSVTEPKINVNSFLKRCGSNLIILRIDNCIISTSVLAASCPKLMDLDTDNVTFLDEDSQPVFHCLVNVIFRNIEFISSSSAARFLLSSPKLEVLHVVSCFLSQDAKTYILRSCENYYVHYISFTGTVLEMNFVKSILCCPYLEYLDLSNCGLHNAEREELAEFYETLDRETDIYFG